MIRKYGIKEAFNRVPRLIISMSIFGDGLEVGANEHYSLDSDIAECCEDFFRYIRLEYPKQKIDVNRSVLRFEYVDLPKPPKQ